MREYVDFLGAQSPYDALDAADLAALARLIEVEFFASGTTIVEAGGSALAHFYVIRTGEVEILDRGRAVDVLGPGETFGQISVLSGLRRPSCRGHRSSRLSRSESCSGAAQTVLAAGGGGSP